MSKDTETQLQATNSYAAITLSLSSPKTGCAKCDGKKLPSCICSKSSGSEENESEEKSSAPTEKSKNTNSMQETELTVIKQEQKIENITREENNENSSSPFSITLTPF